MEGVEGDGSTAADVREDLTVMTELDRLGTLDDAAETECLLMIYTCWDVDVIIYWLIVVGCSWGLMVR